MRRLYHSALACMMLVCSCEKVDFSLVNQEKASSTNETTASQQQTTGKTLSDEHIILLADTTDEDKVEIMYVSLVEWHNMGSSFSTTGEQAIADIAASYAEGDITGWRVPSYDDAIRIKAHYDAHTDLFDELSERLDHAGAAPIYVTTYDNKTYRYLCARGDSTFSFRTGYATLKAGATVKYNLRLVKDTSLYIIPEKINFDY